MEQLQVDDIHDPGNESGVPEHILQDILDIDVNIDEGGGPDGIGGNPNNFICMAKFSVHAKHYEKFCHYESYFFKHIVPRDEGFVACYCMTPYCGSDGSNTTDKKEVYVYLKWANRTSFEQHLQQEYAFDLMQYYYSESHLCSTPQLTIWETVNGAHDELTSGTYLGERLMQLMPQQQVPSSPAGFPDRQAKILTMMRKRSISMRDELKVRFLFQVLVRLALETKEAEKGSCLCYDVLRSRPIEGSASIPDILEIVCWRSEADYVRHTKAPYVQEATKAFSLFFDDSNQSTTTSFWEIQADGLLESNPNIDFMKHHIRIFSNR